MKRTGGHSRRGWLVWPDAAMETLHRVTPVIKRSTPPVRSEQAGCAGDGRLAVAQQVPAAAEQQQGEHRSGDVQDVGKHQRADAYKHVAKRAVAVKAGHRQDARLDAV